jgi:hypothetical protein
MATIKYPFGAADVQAMTATGTQAITITNSLTMIDGHTTTATGNRTLNLSIDSELPIGAIIHVSHKTAATQTLTFGTGITSATITGVTGKTHTQSFIYNGTAFVAMGGDQQID